MFVELFVAALVLACGQALFARFEERTAPWRRLLKVIIIVGGAAVLSWSLGRFASLMWVFGLLTVGITVHFYWTRKHGINPWTAEPRDKYYKLRGWK